MLIDSHAHIHFKDFEGKIDDLLNRARDAGVGAIVNVGTDLASSREVVVLAGKYPQIFAVVGVHPHDAATMKEGDLQALRELAQHPKVVAVGEVGLDYYYEHSPREVQQARLADFIRLAREAGKPLVIHCRDASGSPREALPGLSTPSGAVDAFEDCFRIFDAEDAWGVGGVFHCFTGDAKTAAFIASKGFYVSFSGIVTFKKSTALQEAARTAPMDKILIETDCPFLAPEPHRGKRNEPAYVRLVAQKMAELRNVPFDELSRRTAANTKALFRALLDQ
ncbi:MAG TPA: TatD family hydrolase [bacterium]|nr:TatD family hydrolase [bacterium]